MIARRKQLITSSSIPPLSRPSSLSKSEPSPAAHAGTILWLLAIRQRFPDSGSLERDLTLPTKRKVSL